MPVDAVSAGVEITITRHGHPVARLVSPVGATPSVVAGTIEPLRVFAQGQTLGGLSVTELRDAGRR